MARRRRTGTMRQRSDCLVAERRFSAVKSFLVVSGIRLAISVCFFFWFLIIDIDFVNGLLGFLCFGFSLMGLLFCSLLWIFLLIFWVFLGFLSVYKSVFAP